MHSTIARWILTAAVIGAASAIVGASAQQQARQQPVRGEPAEPAKDYNQRALEIYEFRKAAQSGPARGEEIYFYKCWMCHNEVAQGGAPKLVGLYKRATLVSGNPVNDDTVRNQIRNGSANMPAYKYVLSEDDLNDLMNWLRDEKCCWNSDAPPLNPRYKGATAPAQAKLYGALTGGPKGIVKNARGEPIEGIMVQLIAESTAIRTTVVSHDDGGYEFPKVVPGTYTLRIAKPREFYPFARAKLEIKGTETLDDITLLRVTPGEFLPPFPGIAAQLTGSEWLQNLPGTGEEKKTLTVYCNFCHEYQQIFRNRYDENGWAKIIFRMTHGAGSPLINIRNPGRLPADEEAKFARWLASVRGPDSKDPNFVVQPRPRGRQAKVVITEYELPRLNISGHDTGGDAQGRVWYSTHRSSYVGRLDPGNGHVEEFRVPLPAAGALPGTHWIFVDPKGAIWGSENWAHNIWTLDPNMKDFKRVHWNVQEPVNSPMGGNYSLDEEGNIWRCREGEVARINGADGSKMQSIKTKKFGSTYGSAMSRDYRYFGGGAWPRDGVVIYDRKTGEVFEPDTSPNSGPARGEFDPEGNYWAAGRGGQLVKFDIKTKRVHEYPLPTPYTSLYTANADKNGEVWAGELNGGHYLRFDPKTEQFTAYTLPEPFSMDRESWIDNSTSPVSVWYVDHDGWLVHIQPLD
jgi:virginiamycin B lyase